MLPSRRTCAELGVLLGLLLLVAWLSRAPRRLPHTPPYVDLLWPLQRQWYEDLRPPALAQRQVVYCSGPLFNLSEVIYALGWQGLVPPAGSLETLYGLTRADLAKVAQTAADQGLPAYGLCGELARQGFEAYCPARDGFTLVTLLAALNRAGLPPADLAEMSSYLSKAVYAIDAYCLGAVCNCGILNANGLQIDDGSATEVGMMGMRGMPLVIYRDQATSQLGPGLQNPMPIGNASASLSPAGYPTVQAAVGALRQKVDAVLQAAPAWMGAAEYARDVPPPPLYIYWQAVGEAVFRVKYRGKKLLVDANGRLDAKASFTDFFYDKLVADPSDANVVLVAKKITEAMKQAEQKFAHLIALYPETQLPDAGGVGYGR